jgi:predicted component of type VI protein secretion system
MSWLGYNEALQELRSDSEIIVGTGPQATWRLRRADLMPRHFVVSVAGDRATVRPFSRETVVTVNGRQLPAGDSELHDGDVISAGSGNFLFWANDPGENPEIHKKALMAHLVDSSARSSYSLHRISTGIGGDESNAVVIQDPAVSSFHAEIRREAGGYALRVCDGAFVKLNGTLVTAPVLLQEGDQIEFGNRVFRYAGEPLSADVSGAPSYDRLTSGPEVEAPVLASTRQRSSTLGELSPAITLRAPMRAVAFVSSVIAAVAIATLVFLHRGP